MTYTRSINKSSFRQRQYRNSQGSRPGFQKRGNPRRREYINPALFVKKGIEPKLDIYTPTHSFADFAISDQIKQNVAKRGYVSPTPIQDQAIPHILLGRDVVGMANTGTGKTAAFLLPLIDKVFKDKSQRVLIIAPTRELAVQIEDEFRHFCRGMQLYSALCIGGAGIFGQIKTLRRNPHFVIGTPGRLKDLEQQRVLDFSSFATIVLDEVDRMLDMGFINDVRYIVGRLKSPRHSLFFSATMPKEVTDVMHSFLHNPVTVSVKSGESALYVDQDVVRTNGKLKVDVLHDLLIQQEFEKVLVFGRTKWGMEKLAREMESRGFKVASIHGNKSQGQRQRAIEQFKTGKIQALLATDVASRGLDIENVTHVINYDIPESYEDYVHRIGRTGRAGRKGNALTFLE